MPNSLKRFIIRKKSSLRHKIDSKNRDRITFKQQSSSNLSYADQENQITVILTLYRRSEYLEKQIAAIRNQTIKPKEIWLWCNSSGTELNDYSDLVDKIVVSNFNWKFFGRFSLAGMVDTNFTAIFDDDIFPGEHWFENCVRAIDEGKDGILGGTGILFGQDRCENKASVISWQTKGGFENDTEVDFVGHTWFFRSSYIKYMWMEKPLTFDNGEDIHFSAMAKRYGNIKTYVPRHPKKHKSHWSSDRDVGYVVGKNNVAAHKTANNFSEVREKLIQTHQVNGWTPVIDVNN